MSDFFEAQYEIKWAGFFPTLETWPLVIFTYKDSLFGNLEFKNLTEKKCYLQILQVCVIVKDIQGQVVQLHFRQVPNDIVPMHRCCTAYK